MAGAALIQKEVGPASFYGGLREARETNAFQSLCIMFASVLLAKAGHSAKPRLNSTTPS